MLAKLTKSVVAACLLDLACIGAERVGISEDGPLLQAVQAVDLAGQNQDDWHISPQLAQTESKEQAAESAVEPVEPTESVDEPAAESAFESMDEVAKQDEQAAEPFVEPVQPADSMDEPAAESASESVDEAAEPDEQAVEPTTEQAVVEQAAESANDPASVDEATEPEEQADEPFLEPVQPAESVDEPAAASGAESVDEAAEPEEQTAEPAVEPVQPAESVDEPAAESASESVDGAAESDEHAVEPAAEPAVAKPASDASDEPAAESGAESMDESAEPEEQVSEPAIEPAEPAESVDEPAAESAPESMDESAEADEQAVGPATEQTVTEPAAESADEPAAESGAEAVDEAAEPEEQAAEPVVERLDPDESVDEPAAESASTSVEEPAAESVDEAAEPEEQAAEPVVETLDPAESVDGPAAESASTSVEEPAAESVDEPMAGAESVDEASEPEEQEVGPGVKPVEPVAEPAAEAVAEAALESVELKKQKMELRKQIRHLRQERQGRLGANKARIRSQIQDLRRQIKGIDRQLAVFKEQKVGKGANSARSGKGGNSARSVRTSNAQLAETDSKEDWHLGVHPKNDHDAHSPQLAETDSKDRHMAIYPKKDDEANSAQLAQTDSKELSVLDHFERALDWLVGDCKAGFFVCRYHGSCKINDSGKDLAYWESYMKELEHRKTALLASFQDLGVEAEVDAMISFCNAAPTLAILDPPSFFTDELEKHRQATLTRASTKEKAPEPALPVLTAQAEKYFPNGIPKPASIQEVQEAVRITEAARELSALEMLNAQQSIGGFEGALGWLVGDCKAGYLVCRYHGTCNIHENAEDLAYWETYMKELKERKNALVTSFKDIGRPLGVTEELDALVKLCDSAPTVALLDPPNFFTDELEAHRQRTLAKANQEQFQDQETAPQVDVAAPQAQALRVADYDVPKIDTTFDDTNTEEKGLHRQALDWMMGN